MSSPRGLARDKCGRSATTSTSWPRKWDSGAFIARGTRERPGSRWIMWMWWCTCSTRRRGSITIWRICGGMRSRLSGSDAACERPKALILHKRPPRIRIVFGHLPCELGGIGAEVFLVDIPLLIHDERHDPRFFVVRGEGHQREAGSHVSIDDI